MSKILRKYCLDTHPLVWYLTGQKTLSPKAKQALDDIFFQKNVCFISAIVFLELFHLSLKHKKFIFPQLLNKLRLTNIVVVPLDKIVLRTCYQLPKELNIHDRVICATAKVNNCVLVTKDKEIGKYSGLKIYW